MAGFIDNSGRRGSSLPDPQSINKQNAPIKKRVIKSSPNKKKNNVKRLQSTVTANGGKRSQGIYNGKKLEDPTIITPPKTNSKRSKNNNSNNTPKHSKSGTARHTRPKNDTRKSSAPVSNKKTTRKNNNTVANKTDVNKKRKTTQNKTIQHDNTTIKNNRGPQEFPVVRTTSLNSSATPQEIEKIGNFNKAKNNKDNKKTTHKEKDKKEGYWEKRKRLKKEREERKLSEQKKREEQKERLKKNEEKQQNLTISDIEKSLEKENNTTDAKENNVESSSQQKLSHENSDTKETVISKDNSSKKKKKKKKKVFGKIIGIWSVLLVIAACVIGPWGYYEWTQASINKERDAAYQEGFRDSTDAPTINNVLKVSEQDLSKLISSAPGASFPNNPVLERYTLDGWAIPGGSETHGRAKVSMCYTGEGISERKKASAYLVSDNANSENPNWSVDSVVVTGDNCTVGESAK